MLGKIGRIVPRSGIEKILRRMKAQRNVEALATVERRQDFSGSSVDVQPHAPRNRGLPIVVGVEVLDMVQREINLPRLLGLFRSTRGIGPCLCTGRVNCGHRTADATLQTIRQLSKRWRR